jgi:hypothetical protein
MVEFCDEIGGAVAEDGDALRTPPGSVKGT